MISVPHVPTDQERKKLHSEMLALRTMKESKTVEEQPEVKKKILSKEELNQLLGRLTQITRKEHDLQDNAEKVIAKNKVVNEGCS